MENRELEAYVLSIASIEDDLIVYGWDIYSGSRRKAMGIGSKAIEGPAPDLEGTYLAMLRCVTAIYDLKITELVELTTVLPGIRASLRGGAKAEGTPLLKYYMTRLATSREVVKYDIVDGADRSGRVTILEKALTVEMNRIFREEALLKEVVNG